MSSAEMSSASMSSVEMPYRVDETEPRRYRGAFGRLYRGEMRLILTRRRNVALLGVLAVVPLIIGVAVKIDDPGRGNGPRFLGEITGNGLFLVFTALAVALPFFLPLIVGVVAGDSIAGEAGSGTLRYLLTVPVTRTRLLVMKSLAMLTFTAVAVASVAVVGLVAGAALFGLHDVTLLSGDTVSIGEGLLRTLGVVAYVVLALFALAAGGVFISTLTENAIAAMASTVAIAVFSAVLDAVPQLSAVHPYLLTDHWLGFGEALRTERLLLRPWVAQDFAPFADMNADVEVMEHFPARLDRLASDDFAARIAAHLDEYGWGLWALEPVSGPDAGRFAGFTGLAVPSWPTPFGPLTEVGWRLPRWAWGRGYATEAARAALGHGFDELGLDEIVAYTATSNTRSQAVMLRLGMRTDPAEDFDHLRVAVDSPVRRHVLYRLRASRWSGRS